MTSQKHTVATDALATLGTIIDDKAGRDAIHLAVEPVVAGEQLFPGQHIRIDNGVAVANGETYGIVDPFLKGSVGAGQRFWFVIYPRQITSLRHVWEHPAFAPDVRNNEGMSIAEAEAWLRNYADEIDETFSSLLEAADDWVSSGDYFYGSKTGDYYGKFEGEGTHPDFWKYYQVYRDVAVPEDKQHSFFTCSC